MADPNQEASTYALMKLNEFSTLLSGRKLVHVRHRPDPDAQPTMCFMNVVERVRRDGGQPICGWMFHERASQFGGYFIGVHHCVWQDADGHVFDITPLHENALHHPLMLDAKVLFSLDINAAPTMVGGMPMPSPSRFFALDESEELTRYLKELTRKEEQCWTQRDREVRSALI